MKQENII